MGPSRHPFTRRFLRALSFVLAAVLALSPVVSTAAQTHEASHAAQGDLHFHAHEHSHDAGADPHAPVVRDDADHADRMADADGVLHVLAHAAHACGHSVAIVGGTTAAPRADVAAIVLPLPTTPHGDAPRAHPFRPPIR